MNKLSDLYLSGDYLSSNPDWHASDAPWKAQQISSLIRRNTLSPRSVIEIGCGSGAILASMASCPEFQTTHFTGYDISPQAIDIARQIIPLSLSQRICIIQGDPLRDKSIRRNADILMMIDVVEHVSDYMGFLASCCDLAPLLIAHMPLDLHVSSILRNAFVPTRYSIGHLHYFTCESALASLTDTGFEVLDFFLTDSAFGLFQHHSSLKRALANVPRATIGLMSKPWSARLFGGYSLLALCRSRTYRSIHA